jgi:hypothetical protein
MQYTGPAKYKITTISTAASKAILSSKNLKTQYTAPATTAAGKAMLSSKNLKTQYTAPT